MMKIFFIFILLNCFVGNLFAQNGYKKSDLIASCSLGKIANETEDQKLKKSECVQYCVNAFAQSKTEYLEDGTVKKSVCQWNNRDVLVLGGFTNDGSPEKPKVAAVPTITPTSTNLIPQRNVASTQPGSSSHVPPALSPTEPLPKNETTTVEILNNVKPKAKGKKGAGNKQPAKPPMTTTTTTFTGPTEIVSDPNQPPQPPQ